MSTGHVLLVQAVNEGVQLQVRQVPAFSGGRGGGRGDAFDLIHGGQRFQEVAPAGNLESRFLSGSTSKLGSVLQQV